MPIDKKSLAQASQALADRRARDAEALEKRREEVYARIPGLRELDKEISTAIIDVVGQIIQKGADPQAAISAIAKRNLDLQAERAELLVAHGYPIDYTDEKYRCERCHDTGRVGGEPCTCLMELYRAGRTAMISALPSEGKLGFGGFDLSLYSDKPDAKLGIVPRRAMKLALETCRSYAENFGDRSINLLLRGGPGLGKTYLASCVAREVALAGFSVVYETAGNAVTAYENQKFSRDAELKEQADEKIAGYQDCDLLVLDDFGSEIATAFSSGALYALLSARLMAGKKTLLCTNQKTEELHRRYSPGLISRLEGDFEPLLFYGEDIRRLRREARR